MTLSGDDRELNCRPRQTALSFEVEPERRTAERAVAGVTDHGTSADPNVAYNVFASGLSLGM